MTSTDSNILYIKFCNKVKKPSARCFYYAWNSAMVLLVVFAIANIITTSRYIVQDVRMKQQLRSNLLARQRRGLLSNYNGDSSSLYSNYKASLYHVQSFDKSPDAVATPNLYEMMGNPQYCDERNCTSSESICHQKPPRKFISKKFWFQQPQQQQQASLVNEDDDHHNHNNNNRLIPRIIHQSWFKEIDEEEHPNLSRIQNSWKSIGEDWEYRFYNDEEAAKYIQEHFPKELYEAYDALLPGAFKADFFRYCVLFREGGVWADIDMQLQINLDHFIDNDDGFIVPRDVGGHALHNALIMSAPGHPILAKAIEETTNMIRNRYTVIDIAGRYCPNVNHDVMKDHMALFLTGPGLLAYAMKATFGYPLSLPFEPGTVNQETVLKILNIPKDSTAGQRLLSLEGSSAVGGVIPGKTKLLERITGDMDETRYTDIGKNVIVAGTDIQDGYDTKDKDEHYSQTREATKVWGLEKVYKDRDSANEQIQMFFVAKQ